MMKKLFLYFLMCFCALPLNPAYSAEDDTAKDLIKLILAARGVLAKDKPSIETPSKLDPSRFMSETRHAFDLAIARKYEKDDPVIEQLMNAIEKTVKDAKNGRFAETWAKEKFYPNRLLPARFAILVAKEFQASQKKFRLHLTTQKKWLVKDTNAADDWEEKALGRFESQELKPYEVYFEDTTFDGKPARRAMKGEYAERSCLTCHGDPKGAEIHFSKKSYGFNALAGGVSIVIFKD